eukprot:scaffold47558_cov71-Phaeocystis_antarctica.AAC.6
MAVSPVCALSVQDPKLGAPGVPRDRAHRERALNDGPEGDHRRCGARQCQHLACGTVPRAAQLGPQDRLPAAHSSPPPAPPPRRPCSYCRGCTRTQTTAPHRLPRSIGHAELAHGGAVHVVVEGHGADAHASVGARGAVVGEREEVALHPRIGRLGVDVGPRSTHTSRRAGVRGPRLALLLSECMSCRAAARQPAGASGDAAAEVEIRGRDAIGCDAHDAAVKLGEEERAV